MNQLQLSNIPHNQGCGACLVLTHRVLKEWSDYENIWYFYTNLSPILRTVTKITRKENV